MSLYSEYMALRKKRLEEESKEIKKNNKSSSGSKNTANTTRKVNPTTNAAKGSSLLDGYLKLREQRLYENDDIAPVSDRVKSRMTTNDAPTKKKDERTWFQKGALDDGYDFGDITKTILGTGADIVEDIGTGIIGMGEKAVDALATVAPYLANAQVGGFYYSPELQKTHDKAIEESKKDIAKFVKKDLYDEADIAKKIVGGVTGGYNYESDSVFGEKSDSVIQSGGQLLGTMGLQAVGVPWFLTTGATAFGSESENALNQGATMEEAILSSSIAAGAEILTEKLSGGIKFGGKAADDFLTDQIARGISNKFMRNVAKFFPDALGEGFEEWITEDINKFGQWLTYRSEDELKELLFSEEAMDEKIEAFIGGAALGGVSNAGKAIKSNIKGVDAVSGLNKSEEAVVNKVYNELVAEAEQDGKVSAKEKSKIYDRVIRELEKGGISTDVIEEVLDEEGYGVFKNEKMNFLNSDTMKSYKNALSNEESQLKQLQEELDKLADAPNTVGNNRRYDSIVSQMTELKENPGSNAIKAKLDQEVVRINDMKNQMRTRVHEMVKGTKLGESYNELIRSGQKYTADVSKYENEHAKKTIQNILNSGMGDNTTKFHEYADWLAKISADKGMSFSLTNNEALKGTEHDFSAEGLTTNGYVSADGIVLNMDSPKALNSTVGHEVTHVLEQTDLYKTLQDTVFKYEVAKNGQEAFDKRLKAIEARYHGKDADAKAELTADLIGDYLFTDYDFVHNLSTENRNVFQKIYDEIKYLCKVVTAGSKEARELEKVKKVFEDAYRANVKTSGDTTKYALENGNNRKYNKRSRYNETETLFMIWENGSAPVGEVKKFVRYGKTRYYEKTENGCVELSRSQYNERYEVYVEKDYRRAESEIGEAANYDESTQRGIVGYHDSNRHSTGTEAVFGKTFLEELSNDTAGSLSSTLGHSNGNDLNQTEYNSEASEDSDAFSITFSNDYATIRNYMKDGDTGESDTQYSLSDTKGRELSNEQSEFFKDSKIRDVNGNLKVMHHGSQESFTVFDKKKAKTSGYYGKGFYFTDSDSHAKQYGNTYDVYLNITNPLQDGTNDITKDQLRKFVEAIAENEDYGIDNYGYDATVDRVTDSVYGKSDFAMLMDINASCVGNMVEAIELFNEVNGTDYNGIIAPTETVAFYPEQIKNVDNTRPTSDPDIRKSLSNTNEKTNQYGDWNVYGRDFGMKDDSFAPVIPTPNRNVLPGERMSAAEMFPDEPDVSQVEYDNLTEVKDALEARMIEMSETGDFTDLETINDKWVEAKTRLAELEAELSDTDRVDSLMDSEAPPEMDAPYYESEPTTLTKKATADIVRDVRASLALNNTNMADAKDIIERYRTGEIQTREDLVNTLQDKFGTYKETESNERLAEVKKAIRSYRLNVSDSIKHGIADYAKLMRSMRGKMLFAKDGLAVDEAYKDLQHDFPDFFNEDKNSTPEDQFRQIVDIANTPHVEEVQRNKDIENIEEAADLIIKGIGDFKRNQDLALSNKESKGAFESLMRQADRYAPMDDIAPVAVPKTETTNKTPVKPVTKPAAKQTGKVAEVLTKPSKKPKEGGIGGKVVSALVDKGAVFEKVSLDSKNMEVQAKWNYALPTNTEARAQYFMENGENGVKSLKSVMKEVNKAKKTDAFQNYLYHVHNIDRMTLEDRFGVPNKAVYGDSVTADISRKKAAQLARQNPEFQRWAQDIYNINKQVRSKLVEGGLITQEVANLWEQMYPHYVPITRVDANGANVNVPLDTNKTGVNNPVKRATGGNSNIEPLFNTMAQRIEQTYRAIARNSFGIELKNTLGTALENKPAAGVDEMIDTIEMQEELLKQGSFGMSPTFTVFENGERVEFEITEDMYDALKPTNKILASRNPVIKWLGDNRRNLLTVWNPVFALYRNPIKDIQDVAINSQHAVRTYLNVPNAIFQIATDGKYATEYHQNGGKSNTYFDSRKNEFKAEDNLFKKAIGMPLRAIENAGEFIEEIPRLAEYIGSRQVGRSVERSMLDAARVTTNFAAGGDFTKFLNSHGFTFLNASVQGASQHVRNFREATKLDGFKGFTKTLAKYVIAGVGPMLLNGMLWDDDEEYDELSDYVKENYFVVAKTEEGKFVRIPKGRTTAVMHEVLEQMENLVTGDDEADFSTFFELFLNNIAPNNPLENNILAPIAQAYNNNAWYDGDIVPSRLQDLPAEEQFDESTDSISKWLGEKLSGTPLEMSPMKINYLLDQYSGGLGDVALPMLTPEAESGDDTLTGNLLAPWKKEMTTDKILNNKNPGNFYDLKDELEVISNGKNATDEDKMKSTYMQAVSWEMGDLYSQKREVQSSDLPASAKYEQVRELQEQINELAKNALGGYENVSINGLYSEVGDKRFNHDAESGNWYEIKPKNSDGSDNWYYQKEQEVTKGLGISYGEYWNNREEYNYAYDNPEKYTLSKAVGGYQSYRSYSSDLWDIKADKDKNGKSINGSRKKKVIEYINEMDADYGEKIILFKSEYNADDTYNHDIIEYLNSREDISYQEMETILKYLGFNVDSKGNISW